MEDIRFRQYVWDDDSKVTGGRMQDWDELLSEQGEALSSVFTTKFSNTSALMQYTGLKDKNGTEIYEGDIIGFEDYTSTESGYYEQQCTGVVEWRDETVSFEVSNRLSAESYEVLDECLVIGNIYEHKELVGSLWKPVE